MKDVLGYDPEILFKEGVKICDFIHPDDQPFHKSIKDQCKYAKNKSMV